MLQAGLSIVTQALRVPRLCVVVRGSQSGALIVRHGTLVSVTSCDSTIRGHFGSTE